MQDDRAIGADTDRRRNGPTGGHALGVFVRETRAALGMSQTEAARKASISKTTWQNIEAGRGAAMRPLTTHAVARTLGLDATLLVQLRDGVTSLDHVRRTTRSREEVLAKITQYATWLRLDDLLAVEEAARIRAELRRLQRTGAEPGIGGERP